MDNFRRRSGLYGALDMAVIYPDQSVSSDRPGALRFEISDRAMRAILDGGFEPYLRIGDSWHVPNAGPSSKRREPTNRANWVRAAVEVVKHYHAIAGSKLRYVEVWNEPDHRQFWDGRIEEFFPLFDESVRTIKAAAPELKVGGPALPMPRAGFGKRQGAGQIPAANSCGARRARKDPASCCQSDSTGSLLAARHPLHRFGHGAGNRRG